MFDKPFLIYLQETSSDRPYFAAWIETEELLEEKKPAFAEKAFYPAPKLGRE